MNKPTITLYIAARDLNLVENGPVTGRNRRDAVAHLIQVSFPLDHYEMVPSVENLGLFTVTRR